MFRRFYPDRYEKSVYGLDFAHLYEQGYRGVIFDIDNTLVLHGAPADDRAKKLFCHLKTLGFKVCLISNNDLERVGSFAQAVGQVAFVEDAHKPSRTAYFRALKLLKLKRKQVLFIGDQVFTDVYGARRAGIYSILVKPMGPKEELQIVLKRPLEKVILYFYRKRMARIRKNS